MTLLVALLLVASVALRGHLPGLEPAPRDRGADNPMAVATVVGLLTASVAVVAVAVVARLRNRRASAPSSADRQDWLRGRGDRPTWRMMLIAFGAVLAWLLVAVLLSRLGGGHGSVPAAGSGTTPGRSGQTPGTGVPSGSLPVQPDSGSNVLGYFYAATVIFLFVLVVGTVIASRRQRRPGQMATPPAGDDAAAEADRPSESLARAAEVGLAEVGDLTREPRKAIIACYAAMERELARLPDAAPRDFDTASEVLARAVDHHVLGPDSATRLVDLFDEARFSPHVMNEGHRDAAVAALRQVLEELRIRA